MEWRALIQVHTFPLSSHILNFPDRPIEDVFWSDQTLFMINKSQTENTSKNNQSFIHV
jgi:hypothetical protein